MLIAIDTSVGSSVAVVDAARGVLAEVSVDDSRRHAELIGSLISECLAAADVSPQDFDAVAVGMGPGPFTGLRVGIAAANTFALGCEVPVLHVMSHDAIAMEHAGTTREPFVVSTDARRRERYWSAYSGLDTVGVPVRERGPDVAGVAELDAALTDLSGYVRLDADRVSAAALGKLAVLMRQHGRNFAEPEPFYLRSPDVTVPGAKKRVTEKRDVGKQVQGRRERA